MREHNGNTQVKTLFSFERSTLLQAYWAYSSAGLERTPDKREVDGSSPFRPIKVEYKAPWGFSSAGRAPALQAGGHRFDPVNLHWQRCQLRTLKTGY